MPETEHDQRIKDAIAARPLDVYDIAGVRPFQHPAMGSHWYWCRKHQRAEHVGWAMDGCVRIGPFMSEGEAMRLDAIETNMDGPYLDRPALGMEIE